MTNVASSSILSTYCPVLCLTSLFSASFFVLTSTTMAPKIQTCFFILCVYFVSLNCCTASTKSVAVLVGSPIEISCASFVVPPMWTWVGPKQNRPKTLAFYGTQPHPNLKDPRYSFSQSESNYVLRISNVELTDAGTINCQGDALHQTLVNVIR